LLDEVAALDAMGVADHADHGFAHAEAPRLPPRRSANAASRRRSASSRIGRGVAKLKRSHVSPPGPNCGPGLAKMRARVLTLAATSSGVRPVPAKSTQARWVAASRMEQAPGAAASMRRSNRSRAAAR